MVSNEVWNISLWDLRLEPLDPHLVSFVHAHVLEVISHAQVPGTVFVGLDECYAD